jgi:hypothetical protein
LCLLTREYTHGRTILVLLHSVRFQTRLLLTYSVLILLLVVALGIGFYRYSSTLFEQNAYTNLSVLANRMSQQVDNLIRPMDFVTMYLLSNGEFMSAMASLSALDRADPDNLLYLNEGWQTINGALLSYSLTKLFTVPDLRAVAVLALTRSAEFRITKKKGTPNSAGFSRKTGSWKPPMPCT